MLICEGMGQLMSDILQNSSRRPSETKLKSPSSQTRASHNCNNGDRHCPIDILRVDPLERPVSLLLDGRHGLDGVEEAILLHGVADVRVDQDGVHFRVNVLDGNLEAVEAAGFRDLDLGGETLEQIFVHNAVAGREECEDVRDEVLLVRLERLPVTHVLGQIDLRQTTSARYEVANKYKPILRCGQANH